MAHNYCKGVVCSVTSFWSHVISIHLESLGMHTCGSSWRIISQTCEKLKNKIRIENEFGYTILVWEWIHKATKKLSCTCNNYG